MASIEAKLVAWLAAGVIDAGEADRIRRFEAAQQRQPSDRPSVLEASIYLGLAAIVVGAVVMAASNWESLVMWARIAVPATPGLLGLAAGQALRRTDQPALKRGGHMAWLASAVLIVIAVAVTETEAGWDEVGAILVLGSCATAVGLALWVVSPSNPQVVGLAGGLLLLSIGVGANATEHETLFGGITLSLFGLAGVLLTWKGFLEPPLTARPLTALAFAAGAFAAGMEETGPLWAELLVFVAGAMLVGLSIYAGSLLSMVIGVAALFVGTVSIILRHVGNPTVAALLLMLIGVAVIAGVLILVRVRPWQRNRQVAS